MALQGGQARGKGARQNPFLESEEEEEDAIVVVEDDEEEENFAPSPVAPNKRRAANQPLDSSRSKKLAKTTPAGNANSDRNPPQTQKSKKGVPVPQPPLSSQQLRDAEFDRLMDETPFFKATMIPTQDEEVNYISPFVSKKAEFLDEEILDMHPSLRSQLFPFHFSPSLSSTIRTPWWRSPSAAD